MKKILSLFIVLLISIFVLASCSSIEGIVGNIGGILPGSGDNSGTHGKPSQDYKYTDFSDEEKAILSETLGAEIPFAPCRSYYFEGVNGDFSQGIRYYTVGSNRSEFNSYLALLEDYEHTDTYIDQYGDTWYTYVKAGVSIDISHYFYGGSYYIDIIARPIAINDNPGNDNTGNNGGNDNTGGNTGNNTGNGNTGDNTGSGNTGDNTGGNTGNDNTGGTTTEVGYREIDFTKATNVKDVTDQGYYADGCPPVGSPKVLVIPVEFSDCTAASKGYTIDKLVTAWTGDSDDVDYYSVHDYYYISSYGALDLDITVLDFWFRPSKTSSYYESQTMDYYGDDLDIGDQMIMDEALAYLESRMDLSEFDSDGNDIIDAVVMVNTLDIGEDDFHWAYRYWNLYTDSNEYYYEYDGVSANDYIWMSYQFMYETTDYSGETVYTDTSAINTYTFIHEFAHILGADDYYDTAYVNHPLDGHDMMDNKTGDHSAFTKFNYGWVTSSRLVNTTGSVTLTLEDFSKNGDTIILANNWSDSLGAYQEYYIVVYYKNSGLNYGDGYGIFDDEGIVVYHVNATIEYDSDYQCYDLIYNNTDPSDSYGTENNLVEFVKSSSGKIVYSTGDKMANQTSDNGKSLGYTFTVDSLEGDVATITFTKK